MLKKSNPIPLHLFLWLLLHTSKQTVLLIYLATDLHRASGISKAHNCGQEKMAFRNLKEMFPLWSFL